MAYYRQVYELERAAKDFSDAQRLQMRQDLAVPILEQFRRWLEAQRPAVLPKSPLGEALGYALHNWTALIRYTEAGYLAIDNNVAEREMKRIPLTLAPGKVITLSPGGQNVLVKKIIETAGVKLQAKERGAVAKFHTTDFDALLPLHGLHDRPGPAARRACR